MNERTLIERVHGTDTTLRDGTSDIELSDDDLDGQLRDREREQEQGNVTFLRAAWDDARTDKLVESLGECAAAEAIETRGNTATYH